MEAYEEIQQPRMKMFLPGFDESEFRALVLWAAVKKETWPFFASWLDEILMQEVQRRCTPGMEAEMLCVPRMTGAELGECLAACYVLSRSLPMTKNQVDFVEELLQHLISHASAALDVIVGDRQA